MNLLLSMNDTNLNPKKNDSFRINVNSQLLQCISRFFCPKCNDFFRINNSFPHECRIKAYIIAEAFAYIDFECSHYYETTHAENI